MKTLVRGEKIRLPDLLPAPAAPFRLAAQLRLPSGDVPLGFLALDGNDQGIDARHVLHPGQPATPCGGLSLAHHPRHGLVLSVDPARLSPAIRRVAVAAFPSDPASRLQTGGFLRLLPATGEDIVAEYPLSGADFADERALVLGELYWKDLWRLAATGQGFTGGKPALFAHYKAPEPAAIPLPVTLAPAPAPAPAAPAPSPAPAPAAAPIRLGKITLDKPGASRTISLRKDSAAQNIHVNLNWDAPAPAKSGGWFGKSVPAESPDIDLGCMFHLTDGSKGVIQPLGGNFGSQVRPPFILLDKDDRSGAAADGENLVIYRPDLIEKVLLFALIYSGAATFTAVNARLTLREQDGTETLVRLDSPDPRLTFCAIAILQRSKDSGGLEVTKTERYFPSHRQADEEFGFGFRWTAGSK